jgi:hypothetical protein
VPDFDRYVQEREYQDRLGEMAGGEQSNLFTVSIYQTLRARGPDPNLAALTEAVDFCAESIESAGDCKVGRGEFRQHELWTSSLPLGRDVYGRARKYPTDNTGDMVPAGRHQVRLADGDPVCVRRCRVRGVGPVFGRANPRRRSERPRSHATAATCERR